MVIEEAKGKCVGNALWSQGARGGGCPLQARAASPGRRGPVLCGVTTEAVAASVLSTFPAGLASGLVPGADRVEDIGRGQDTVLHTQARARADALPLLFPGALWQRPVGRAGASEHRFGCAELRCEASTGRREGLRQSMAI